MFALVVCGFGVKVNSEQEATHLVSALQEKHETDVRHTELLHAGATFKWNYVERVIEHSIPNCMPNLLKRINYQPKDEPQHLPRPFPHATCRQKT